MKKRLLSILLCSVLALNLTVPTIAAYTPAFVLDTQAQVVEVDDCVEVTVSIAENPGIVSLQMDVCFDTDLLSCTSIAEESVLAQDGVIFDSNENNNGKASFAAISSAPMEGDGALATLTFRAKKAGACELSTQLVFIETEDSELTATEDSLSITVKKSSASTEIVPSAPSAPQTPAEDTVSFSDVPESHWAYTFVQDAVKAGLFSGVGADRFAPDMTVTRGMFVTVLYSSAGSPDITPVPFNDVLSDAWYANAVSWASRQGIVSGIGNGNFGPDLPITREQIALILYQYAKGTSPGTELLVRMFYPDGNRISSWSLTALSWALNEGLISGKSGNLLAPQDTATRAETAVIMQNFAALSK